MHRLSLLRWFLLVSVITACGGDKAADDVAKPTDSGSMDDPGTVIDTQLNQPEVSLPDLLQPVDEGASTDPGQVFWFGR